MEKECAAKRSTFSTQRDRDTKQKRAAEVADATSEDPSSEIAEETTPAQIEGDTTIQDAIDPEVREDEDPEATTDDAATLVTYAYPVLVFIINFQHSRSRTPPRRYSPPRGSYIVDVFNVSTRCR